MPVFQMPAAIKAIKSLLRRLPVLPVTLSSRSYWPLLMPLILYLGAQGLYHWRAQQGFLALIEALNPTLRVEMEGFNPTFDGRLRIASLRLFSDSDSDEALLAVRGLALDGGNWQPLLTMLSPQDALPEQLTLTAARLQLSPARLTGFGDALALMQCATEIPGWQGDARGLEVDLRGTYQFDADSGYTRVTATLTSENLSELSVAFVLAVNHRQPGWQDLINPDNGWAGGRLALTPVAPLFAQRCAANVGMSVRDYMKVHMTGIERFSTRQGWVLGPRSASALQRFYIGARGLSIVIDPQVIVPLARLAAQDAPALLAGHTTQLLSGERDLGPLDLSWRLSQPGDHLPKAIASLETVVREAKEQPLTPQEYVALAATATSVAVGAAVEKVVGAVVEKTMVGSTVMENMTVVEKATDEKARVETEPVQTSVAVPRGALPQATMPAPLPASEFAGKATAKPAESREPSRLSSPYVAEKPPAEPVSRYRRTPVGRLIQHVGEPVRFITTNGRTIEGELRWVRGDVAEVSQQIGTGWAQLPVRISRIDRFYSYR